MPGVARGGCSAAGGGSGELGALATALSPSHNPAMPGKPLTIGRLAAAAILTAGAITAAADARPPWTMPEADYGGATPLNLDSWYRFTDYPEAAIRAGRQGYVTVAFEVLPSGRVGKCKVVRSSGSSQLDSIPCRLIRKRARFEPARDPAGAPRTAEATTSMSFWMPAG